MIYLREDHLIKQCRTPNKTMGCNDKRKVVTPTIVKGRLLACHVAYNMD